MDLVEKAAKLPVRKVRSDIKHNPKDLEQLCFAWLDDKVSYSQITRVLNLSGSSAYTTLAISLKRAYQAGKIKRV